MQTLPQNLGRYVSAFIDAILPARCIMTGEPVEKQGMITPEAWKKLEFITAPYCRSCGLPFEFEAGADTLCVSCLDNPPAFTSARAALKYNDSSRQMILGFKHGDKMHSALAFTPWLKLAAKQMLAECDYILPVPLHYWRLVSRRYNQALLIAQKLGQDIEKPVLADLLKRVRPTPSQGHLNFKEREKNVKRAFALPGQAAGLIKGKSLVLVDDVYTTGATVNECAAVLRKAGAGAVHVLTVARVVRPEFH